MSLLVFCCNILLRAENGVERATGNTFGADERGSGICGREACLGEGVVGTDADIVGLQVDC